MFLSYTLSFSEIRRDSLISLKDIKDAKKKIEGFIHRTPLIPSETFSRMSGAEVYIKAENLQRTGSFKVRGAFSRLYGFSGKVITASMGNHAQAVAFAASKLGIKAKIVMPVNVPVVKVSATRGYGAEVELYGESYRDALEHARVQKNYFFIHGFDDEKIIAGQGTIGLEILEDLKDPDVILVPVGGGGLISGIAVAVKSLSPKTKIIGIQSRSAMSAFRSFRGGRIIEDPPRPTIADGIAIGKVGHLNFEIIQKFVDDIFVVDEDTIAMAVLLFLERKKLVVEGAGASPLAGLLENRKKFFRKKVVLVASGGNIDFNVIDRIIYRGLVRSNRIGQIEVVVDDVPGSLNAITGVIAGERGNILDVKHDRTSRDLPLGKTKITFTMEIRDRRHLKSIVSQLQKRGYAVKEG